MSRSRRQGLENHVALLRRCRRCPRVIPPPVSGGAIVSDIIVIGQAPGVREPTLKRPFAHTAGRTLFRWFEEFCGLDEFTMRSQIYFAAVIRCFPGKAPGGSDRVPAPDEIRNCSGWMNAERSEERRVGKECRSGWAADHYKKTDDSSIMNRYI